MGPRISLPALLAFLPLLASATVPEVDGYTLTWSDDFVGEANTLPNSANWLVQTGTSYPGGAAAWGTGEHETYTSSPNNLALTGDGTLRITPIKDGSGRWTSGRIETVRTDFTCGPGQKMRNAARIMMPDVTGPAAAGYWPAFWTLGAAFRGNYQNWPGIGEFDILEDVNGQNLVYGTLHCGSNPGGPCHETNGLGEQLPCPGSPCPGNWHEYSIILDRSVRPEVLTWYVDGVQFHHVTENDVDDEDVWTAAVHDPHFLLLNLAIGGSFPDALYGSPTPTAATKSGVSMYVDWVAVYNSV